MRNRSLPICFLLLFSLFSGSAGFLKAQQTGQGNAPSLQGYSSQHTAPYPQLDLLSWNIKMLPAITFIAPPGKRVTALTKYLDRLDYDVLLLQECFHHRGRRKIRRGLRHKYPYRVGPANFRPLGIKTNSGLWVLSKHPITHVAEIQFEEFAKFDNRMARKGALMVELQWQGERIHLIVTHQNAGGPVDLRLRQSAAIRKQLIEPYAEPDVPLFVVGDFNLHAENERILKALQDTLGMVYRQPVNQDNPDGVDYIFYNTHQHPAMQVQVREHHNYRAPWKPERHWLSDHPAVSAHITLKDLEPYPKLD